MSKRKWPNYLLPIRFGLIRRPLNRISKSIFLLGILIGAFHQSFSQVNRFPADVTPVLNAPYSLFINDYTDPGKNQLVANIVFNDFNEPTWTFKLRLTIESTDIRLQTIEGYTPPQPIIVQPGVLTQIGAEEWINYLDFNNLTIAGPGSESFRRSGRLPEGLYSFCIEVLDYNTGESLSRETCTNAWIQLNDPPRIVSPGCGSVIDPKLAAFPIQWQLFNTQSPNSVLGTEYQLTIWEITDPTADPMVAVPNAQTLQVFQSQFSTQTTFIYGPAEPLLELGKRYVYQIQARSLDGRDNFKNNGFSEFCHFSYGWPEGGEIPLSWPEHDGGFRSEELPYISWERPNNIAPNQPVSYQIEIMKMNDGQTAEEAYLVNEPWFSRQLPERLGSGGGAANIPANLGKSEKYAWKISAFTGEQKVAESRISMFNGPSLVEYFYAGNHRVEVDYINGKDVTNISGGGKVRLEANLYKWTQLTFENLSLKDNGGFWVLDDGEIFIDPPREKNIALTPFYEDNNGASFGINRYRLDKTGLYAWGKVTWDLPHATASTEKAVVKSVEKWANFNKFKINTVVSLPENGNRFDLLEPFGFTLDLHKSSLIFINQDNFRLELDGDVYVPDNVKRFSDERASFVFSDVPDLYYFDSSPSAFENTIQPVANTLLWMRPTSYTVDLSEKESPGIHSASLDWKGIDIESFDLAFEKSPDHKGQLNFGSPFEHSYQQNGSERYAHITSSGLSLVLNTSYEDLNDGLTFQTFPSNPLSLDLSIEENNVSDRSKLVGDLLIPFASLSDRFGYEIPITNLGFEKGFLTDLEGYQFTHNPDAGDQEIFIKIRRAALSGNERITMTIDLDWPGMGVNLTSLRDFKIWGDYSVGFSAKNGTVALEQRENALMSSQKYPVTIDIIGAGSYKGQYMFATTADIVLGEDVSGPEQEPTVNVYSAVKNPFVPEDQDGVIGELPGEGPTLEEATAQINQQIQEYEQGILSKLNESTDDIKAQLAAYQGGLSTSGQEYIVEDLINKKDESPSTAPDEEDQLYEIVEAFVSVIAIHYTEPLTEITDQASDKVKEVIGKETTKAKDAVSNGVDALVDPAVQSLASALQNPQIDVASILLEVGEIAKASLKQEVNSSLDQAVQDAILEPVDYFLYDEVTKRVQDYLIDNGTAVFYTTLKGENPGQALADLATGIPGLTGQILGDAADLVNPENVAGMVEELANGFISNIDGDEIVDRIKGEARKRIEKELERVGRDLISDLASDFIGEQVLPISDLGANPINFAGIGSKLAEGDVGGAIKTLAVDPVPLNMNTPIVQLSGVVYYTPDDPNYGNAWTGDIEMKVKVPKPFILNALYINGRKENNSYWFVEIRGNEEQGPNVKEEAYKLGDPIPKTVKALKRPVNMGVADLVGVSGRLYHHMRETDNGGIVPDQSMRFGAFMNVVFFDRASGGQGMRLAVAGEINTKETGDYTLNFIGDLQLRSKAPTVENIDSEAAIQGVIEIQYNSAEQHFFGYASVVMETLWMCAQGSLLVDTKPGQWRVAFGTRHDRISVKPLCKSTGWTPTGWLDLNQNTAEVGFGFERTVGGSTPTINFGIRKVRFTAEAGVAVGVLAEVMYNPRFALVKAGFWADLWARILAQHKKPLGNWKSITLVDISLSGELIIYFEPKPLRIEGKVRGKVKILFFKVKVNAGVKQEL